MGEAPEVRDGVLGEGQGMGQGREPIRMERARLVDHGAKKDDWKAKWIGYDEPAEWDC